MFGTKNLLLLFTVLALGASSVFAQFGDLPTCGATCSQLSASKASGCTSSDLKCLCNSNDYVDAVYSCIAGACNFGEQSSTVGHLGQICAEAVAAPDTPTDSTTTGATSSNPGAPVTSTTAPVAFTSTPGVTSSGAATGTTSAGAATGSATTQALGTTTAAGATRPATTSASQSTTVVVKTVGGAETTGGTDQTGASGDNILSGNGASGVRADVLLAGVMGLVGAYFSL